MLCSFLLYNEVNQLYVYIYSLPLGPPSHPPIPLIQVTTEHQGELPALYSRFPPAICFIHGSVYMSILISQFIPHPPSPCCVQTSVLYVCVSIPALQIGSSVKKMWYIYTVEYYSAIKRNQIGSVVEKWMGLESVIQREVSQEEKNKYRVLTHICGIQKNGINEPICRAGIDMQTQRTDIWTWWGKGRVGQIGRFGLT